MNRHWSFSILLGLAYLGIFHLWMFCDRREVIATGVLCALALTAGFAWNARRSGFLNGWDKLIHASVILDILLEALFIPIHDHYGFYWCATGFAVVLIGYRVFGTDALASQPVATGAVEEKQPA